MYRATKDLDKKTVEIIEGDVDFDEFTLTRRDIVDRNNILISRNISSNHAVVIPKLIKNKKTF